ncbi:MAG: methyltransferase, partial [Thiotrichaceae bacterium]
AIVIATQNSRTLAINNITFCHSDWFSNITKTFNIIVSNPPYIEIDDSHLANDIRHEPMMALVSGKDGLNDIRTIIKNSIHFLDDRGGNKGMLFLEHGYNQGTHVCELMKQAGFKDYKTIKDLASNDRVTFGSWSQR